MNHLTSHPSRGRAYLFSLGTFAMILLLTSLLSACLTQKEERASEFVYAYVPQTPMQADDYFFASMQGDYLQVIWQSIDAHRPTHLRLYDHQGQLVYTEKDPALNLGESWEVDMSEYVQDRKYQLFVQLDNGAQIKTWVNRE